jgi:Anti-sigma-K factor rskA
VTRAPDFDDIVEGVESPEERERLRRVHELLAATPPPPELSPVLVSSPVAPAVEEEPDTSWLPPRRLGAVVLVGAALVAAAFGVGYIAGEGGSDDSPTAAPSDEATTRVVSLRPSDQNNTSGASIRLGSKGADGNWPMVLTVRGLDQLGQGDYYTLALTKKGKPTVTCGTFNVLPEGATTIRMVAAYDLDGFDGWAITRYDSASHSERVVMRET